MKYGILKGEILARMSQSVCNRSFFFLLNMRHFEKELSMKVAYTVRWDYPRRWKFLLILRLIFLFFDTQFLANFLKVFL